MYVCMYVCMVACAVNEVHLIYVKLIPQYVEAKRLAHCKKMNAIKKHDKNLLRNTLNAWKVRTII